MEIFLQLLVFIKRQNDCNMLPPLIDNKLFFEYTHRCFPLCSRMHKLGGSKELYSDQTILVIVIKDDPLLYPF